MSLSLIVVMTATLWVVMVAAFIATFYVLHQRTSAIVQRLDLLVREADQMNRWMGSRALPLPNFRHRSPGLAMSQASSCTVALSQSAEPAIDSRVIEFLPRRKS